VGFEKPSEDFSEIEWLNESYEDFADPFEFDRLNFSETHTLRTLRDYMLHDFDKDDLGDLKEISLRNLFLDYFEEVHYGFIVKEQLQLLFNDAINLKTLDLSRDLHLQLLHAEAMIDFATMHKGISKLYISNLCLQQNEMSSLLCLKELEVLDISHNDFKEIGMLTKLPNLKHLNASHNLLTNVDCLLSFPSLKFVDIRGNLISKLKANLFTQIETVIPEKKKPWKRTRSEEPEGEFAPSSLKRLKLND